MMFSIEAAKQMAKPFRGIGNLFLSIFPGVEYDLKSINADIRPEEYSFASAVSATVWGLIFGMLTYILLLTRGAAEQHYFVAIGVFLLFFMFAFILHMIYPGILSRKQADKIDRELLFALRDMLAQVKSGTPFYVALTTIAKSDYGTISEELSIAVKGISAGESEKTALERIVMTTKSEYLKRTIWQVLTALESGASMDAALKSAFDTLMNYQIQAIKNYSGNLNFIILFYMFFAAVLPSIGITLLVLLLSFTTASITDEIFYMVIIASVIVQLAIIGFVKSERPSLY